MLIKHAKVSGIANPADPAIVGGEDWDDAHVLTGFQLIGAFSVRRFEGVVTVPQSLGITVNNIIGGGGSFAVTVPEMIGGSTTDVWISSPPQFNPNTYSLDICECTINVVSGQISGIIRTIEMASLAYSGFAPEFAASVMLYKRL